jgi:hypothetical protein
MHPKLRNKCQYAVFERKRKARADLANTPQTVKQSEEVIKFGLATCIYPVFVAEPRNLTTPSDL